MQQIVSAKTDMASSNNQKAERIIPDGSINNVGDPESKLNGTLVIDPPQKPSTVEIEKKRDDNQVKQPAKIRVRNVGVWTVYSQEKLWPDIPGTSLINRFRETAVALPYIWRFTKEIWTLAPGYLLIWILFQLYSSLSGVFSLWATANLLDTMQSILLHGKVDMPAIRFALSMKFAYYISQWLYTRIKIRNNVILTRRLERHCSAKILEAYARMDLVTLQRKDVETTMKSSSSGMIGENMWQNYQHVVGQITIFFEVASRAYFLFNFFRRQENGWQLAIVCALSPVITVLSYMNVIGDGWFAYASNKAYIRLRSLADIARNSTYVEEIVTSGLGDYIRREYFKAMNELGNEQYENVRVLLHKDSSLKAFLRIFSEDITLLYYFASVVRNPVSFSLTSMAVLRESSNDLFWTVYTLFDGSDRLKETMRLIQDYYSLLELENSMEDGDLAFPVTNAAALPASQDHESQVSQNPLEAQGMKIEFKNVSMQYPENSSYALKNVSFVIPAGATVILVGANGSGKTTTVSLLSRLLDPTAGEILIDDVPVKRYKVQTLRRAQAILRQDYKHFPLSLTENIAIGDPNWFEDEAHAGTNAKATDIAKMTEEKVMRAAKMGDAAEIVEDVRLEYLKKRNGFLAMVNNHELAGTANIPIQEQEKKESKLEKEKESGGTISGWDIMINPVKTWSGSWLSKDSLLKSMSDGIEKKLQLSGGQWQRLALARLFMKAEGDKIRMICADEPSAALDPRAEHRIFERLRTLKGRKNTRIFITHRFGHLTKHADLILCLKNGELVESGTHEELMNANGEYANLYNIQAQAFA